MSFWELTSASESLSYGNYSSFSGLTYSNTTHPSSSTNPREFCPIVKDPGYVAGEQLRLFAINALRIGSYVFSKLPSISFPGVAASALPESSTPVCLTPSGSYESSCNRPVVTYDPSENRCSVTTRCASIYEGLAHRETSFSFPPGNLELVLENQNGTLVKVQTREEAINAQLVELRAKTVTIEALEMEQAAIIRSLNSGEVITVNSDLQPALISSEKWPRKNDGFNAFQRIAATTGGIMGYSPSPQSLNLLIRKMFAHILRDAETSKFIDIAFVIDTTSSMGPYLDKVQENLIQFLLQQQERTNLNRDNFRVALLEFRDRGDTFLNRVNVDFTSDLNQVAEKVRLLFSDEGAPDVPEAVLDALLAAKDNLSWKRDKDAKRIVILIGDAAPHPRTADGSYDENDIVAMYGTTGVKVVAYPVFVERA